MEKNFTKFYDGGLRMSDSSVTTQKEAIVNQSICTRCQKVVPSRHVERDGKIYLVKDCPDCGINEAFLSSDALRWQEKRTMQGYQGDAESTCSMECITCDHCKSPTLVFLDVTNRCNMNCPICVANIPAMGFQFDPPLSYFEKVFKTVGRIKPPPKIQLFGGEPTVREDLIEIINLAKDYGLKARVVTNGIRLANEDYCKKLLATGTQLMFAFDGRSPEIYQKLRHNPHVYEQKLMALENVRRHRKSKITMMCCAGLGVNDEYLQDLIQFCHDGRNYIAALDVIPLMETWEPGKVEAVNTTPEDVEHMFNHALPGTEFLPASIMSKFKTILDVFHIERVTFGGSHPNCESATILISDGETYHPPSKYLKKSFSEVIHEAIDKDAELTTKLKTSLIVRLLGESGKKLLCGWALLGLVRKGIHFHEVFGDRSGTQLARILWGLMRGEKMKYLLRKYTRCHDILRITILPFEEAGCVESARLVECPASFAYEHPVTRQIRLMPVCAWTIFKNDILRETSEQYGISRKEDQPTTGPPPAYETV